MQVPAPFEYARATSVEEALVLLDRLGPEARLIAGGHSLLPMMKLRLATPEHLVDINPLERELLGDLQLLLRVQRDARRLLAVPQRRVEDLYAVHFSPSSRSRPYLR